MISISLAAGSVAAQDAAEDEEREPASPPVTSSGEARLEIDGRPAAETVPFTLTPRGPSFALVPLARQLGVELRIGPLGASHTLVFDDGQVMFGPDQASMVESAPGGRGGQQIVQLVEAPFHAAGGLRVSLELLERTFGERLGYFFQWRPAQLVLAISRDAGRRLEAAINVVHQSPLTTVEIRFSQLPRYRIERSPGVVEVKFLGDRLMLPVRRAGTRDPLVSDVAVSQDRIRLVLAANATAAEPRLLESGVPRLVIEVLEQRQAQLNPPPPRPRRTGDGPGIRTIVLDPGHGGEETGAVGSSGVTEAELVLMVARSLKSNLERRLPVKVVLTRDEDVDVALDTRAAVANQNQADLFISLHINSSFGAQAAGAETYFLSREASDQMAAAAAAAENRGGVAAGADPELGLELILWDLAQSHFLAESQRFASLVQEELNQELGLRNRGVKQAPFRVLMGARMPAVLVELGFLSNPDEEEKLRSNLYRGQLVDALTRAVSRFKAQVDSGDDAVADSGATVGAGGSP